MLRLNKQVFASEQSVFDFVIQKLYRQKYKASAFDGGCLYRKHVKNKVLKCAVGHLIPKNAYIYDIEGSEFYSILSFTLDDSLFIRWQTTIKQLDTRILNLISQLQIAHDTYIKTDMSLRFDTESFYLVMVDLANRFALNTDVLDKICGKTEEN